MELGRRHHRLCLGGPSRSPASATGTGSVHSPAGRKSSPDGPARAAARRSRTRPPRQSRDSATRWRHETPPQAGLRAAAAGRYSSSDRSLHVQKLLSGQSLVDGPTLLPLQHPSPDDRRHVGERTHRLQSADLGLLGRLPHRLPARSYRQPVSVQDCQRTLRGSPRPGQGSWRPHRLQQSHYT